MFDHLPSAQGILGMAWTTVVINKGSWLISTIIFAIQL
uniref:Uncharacterized protein n=1 Tax=uncultured bacterium B19D1_C12D4_E9D6 TaxID=1329637 RepID=S4W330_9BACT|nr:hypothetical protein [uncultured bacterium B19D1_C12D4_E9D6]